MLGKCHLFFLFFLSKQAKRVCQPNLDICEQSVETSTCEPGLRKSSFCQVTYWERTVGLRATVFIAVNVTLRVVCVCV